MNYKNEVGLFIGLLSYPFKLDGRKFYKDNIVNFFETHREFLHKYDDCSGKIIDDELLYKPAGYRLFGTQGLAILSLVDDYSFFTRVFNKNHIQTILLKKNTGSEDDTTIREKDEEFHFNSIVTSGVMETDDNDTIKDKAKKSFLLKGEKKHTFLGIIRLKIDSRVLTYASGEIDISKQGIAVTRDIQKAINKKNNDLKEKRYVSNDLEYICVDCFDNDEMTVIAFANDLLSLYNFLGEIRSLKCNDIEQDYIINGNNCNDRKHVFASALLCFGYDIEKEEKSGSIKDNNNLEGFYINCLIESKTGHRDSLFRYLEKMRDSIGEFKDLFENGIQTNITGGCNIVAKVQLKKIGELEKFCAEDPEFFYHTRKVKISLPDIYNIENRMKSFIMFDSNNSIRHVSELATVLNALRKELKTLGVSKALRDRAMALFELYDNACRNPLQQLYMGELEDALKQFLDLTKELSNDLSESLYTIEDTLNNNITSIEYAIYDRLHHQKYNQAPLEYNGGIQQYLTAFDYAYKKIVSALGKNEKVYVTITGAERASSVRNLLRLNINHIVYPELFAYAVWKEASNYALDALKDVWEEVSNDLKKNVSKENANKAKEEIKICRVLRRWNSILDNKESRILDNIKYQLQHDQRFDQSNPVHNYIYNQVSTEMLSYFVQDVIVLHFTFLYKYELMWHTYLKSMLQTTICYYRINKIDKRYLIYTLLRLFMVYRYYCKEENGNLDNFISDQKNQPFDATLGEAWVECFQKTLDISEIIFDVIEEEEFSELCNIQTVKVECFIGGEEGEQNEDVIEKRKKKSDEYKEKMLEGIVIVPDSKKNEDPVNFLICLLNAYLEAVRDLDYYNKKSLCTVKSVTRKIEDGSILDLSELQLTDELKAELSNRMSNILADPTGGFFTRTAETRQKYFTYRTVLYRSMWNCRFINNKQ